MRTSCPITYLAALLHTHKTLLSPIPPYNVELALAYLRTSPSAILERIDAPGYYRRAVAIDGHDVLLTLHATGSVRSPQLTMDLSGAHINTAIVAQAETFVRKIFSLETNPASFARLGRRDARIKLLIKRYYGLRPVLIVDAYEALLWAIIGQQVNVAFARKLKTVLAVHCGRTLEINGYRISHDATAGRCRFDRRVRVDCTPI